MLMLHGKLRVAGFVAPFILAGAVLTTTFAPAWAFTTFGDFTLDARSTPTNFDSVMFDDDGS